jgi:hypothetical protein
VAKRDYQREAAQRVLWGDREVLLPHCLEHRGCAVWEAVQQLCEDAGWTAESYLLAALFDREELIVEVTE